MSFHVPVGCLHFVFGKMSIQFFSHFLIGLFVFLMLSCVSCLYMLDVNPLLVISFTNVFSSRATSDSLVSGTEFWG